MKRLRSALTVKDVRRLHACSVCGEIGIHQPMHPEVNIPVIVCVHSSKTERMTISHRQASYAHPRCYVAATSFQNLLNLHSDELGAIRLSDVTRSSMEKIVAELRKRRQG